MHILVVISCIFASMDRVDQEMCWNLYIILIERKSKQRAPNVVSMFYKSICHAKNTLYQIHSLWRTFGARFYVISNIIRIRSWRFEEPSIKLITHQVNQYNTTLCRTDKSKNLFNEKKGEFNRASLSVILLLLKTEL